MRKAVTPLVSSIALLAFAVMLGLIVISWGNAYAPEAQHPSCDRARIAVVQLSGSSRACFAPGRLVLAVENVGSVDVNGMMVDVIGSGGIQQLPYSGNLAVAGMRDIAVPFDSSGSIQKIKILPSISIDGRVLLCPLSGFEVEKIEACRG